MDELAKRKHPRLKRYDYSQAGYYHVTLCTQDNLPILSNITVGRGWLFAAGELMPDPNTPVGRELALEPPESVGRGLAPAVVNLTPQGKIVEEQLLALPARYPHIKIDTYVIMPTHLHAIMVLESEAAGASPRPTVVDGVAPFDPPPVSPRPTVTDGAGPFAFPSMSPRPTVMDIVCTFKSLSTRLCNQYDGVAGRKIWQTSFYEEIIRNETAYLEIWDYINTNPLREIMKRQELAQRREQAPALQ